MTTYRNRSFATLMAVVAGIFLAGSLIAAIARDGDFGTRWAPVLPIIALSAFVLLRLARSGVYADERGVKIVNPLRTVRIPWEHLQRFLLKPHKGFPALGFAERLDGTQVQIWGWQARSSATPVVRGIQELVDALNERLVSERERRRALEPTR